MESMTDIPKWELHPSTFGEPCEEALAEVSSSKALDTQDTK